MNAAMPSQRPGTSWTAICWLMLSDIVGTSVLTLNGVAVQLGWLLTTVFIVGLFPLCLYTSVAMSRTRSLLLSRAKLQVDGSRSLPKVGTMGEVAELVFRSPSIGLAVSMFVYGFTLMGQASYLLVLGTSLQMAKYDTPLCLPWAVGISCLALCVPMVLLRQLSESVALCFFNSLLILAVVVIVLVQAYFRHPACTQTFVVAPGINFMTVLGSATNIIYSFSGQWMYFELMETMAVPEEFPKAFAIAGPFMLTTYLTVALLGYTFGAGNADLIAGMDRNGWLKIASSLLFIHVVIVYLIKSVILARFLHTRWLPAQVEERTFSSYLVHGSIGFLMLVLGFVVSNAIPFFSQLLGLIGGLMAGPVNFLLPLCFYLAAVRLRRSSCDDSSSASRRTREVELNETSPREGTSRRSVRTSRDEVTNTGSDLDASQEPSRRPSTMSEFLSQMCSALISLPAWEASLIVGTIVLIVLTMTLGVADEISQIFKLWGTAGAPFGCHLLQEPDIPSCGTQT